jgi:hypothetical protein
MRMATIERHTRPPGENTRTLDRWRRNHRDQYRHSSRRQTPINARELRAFCCFFHRTKQRHLLQARSVLRPVLHAFFNSAAIRSAATVATSTELVLMNLQKSRLLFCIFRSWLFRRRNSFRFRKNAHHSRVFLSSTTSSRPDALRRTQGEDQISTI